MNQTKVRRTTVPNFYNWNPANNFISFHESRFIPTFLESLPEFQIVNPIKIFD